MTTTIVTSFNKAIWDGHGKPCVMSWLKHIKGNYNLHIYMDGRPASDLPRADNIRYFFLDNYADYTKFLRDTANMGAPQGVPPEHQFRFQFRRFWPKVFSIAKEVAQVDDVLWLDADILVNKDFDLTAFSKEHSKMFTILDRGEPWGYCDSGFMLLKEQGFELRDFISKLENIYTTKTIFQFREWHDAYLITQLLKITFGKQTSDQYKAFVESLCGLSSSLHPIEDSPLKEYMVHLKGQRKNEASE